ncbi:MAG: NAD(P)-binding domain-containing protein [Bacteroidales bacterium]|nr:NAD(P)-binding domain-containing protein [Bacteroidales bacterium]
MKIKIGILGSGVVAQVLGSGFLKYGYEVMLGTRNVEKLAEWQKANAASVGSFRDAAEFGDILVLASKGTASETVLRSAGDKNLKGKIVIDTTNPIADIPPVNGVLQYFTGQNDSLMERLQSAFPEASFVKAFNSVGNHLMINPDFGGIKPSMFICGNDANSKKEVTAILDQFGWETEDMGAVEAARAIEPLCILWCIPGFRSNEWMHAFKLLKRTIS